MKVWCDVRRERLARLVLRTLPTWSALAVDEWSLFLPNEGRKEHQTRCLDMFGYVHGCANVLPLGVALNT